MAITLVPDFVERWAAERPDAVALIQASRQTTYAELDRAANRVAQLLVSRAVTAGDRVVIALDNGLEQVAAYLGTMKAGAVAVPLAGGLKSDRLSTAVADCRPRAAIVDAAVTRGAGAAEALSAVATVFVVGAAEGPDSKVASYAALASALDGCPTERPERRAAADDVAAIIYTSGSTGEPRGVVLSHGNFVANAASIVSYLGLTREDRVLCVLPFHYVYGLSLLHTHLAVGGTVVIENRAAFPNVVLAAMQQHRVTGFAGVPSTFALMLHRSNLGDVDLSHLRYITQAGGAMPPARVTEWLERGPKAEFFVMYGATEAAARLTYLPPRDLAAKLGSIGLPIPGVEITIVDDLGRPVAVGQAGELVARGANISRGYWNRPDETALRFSALGYHTGDLGYADGDGYLFLVGRKHDMIKVGAHRVGAKEIEDVLSRHPAVHEVAVVGVAHDMLGEVPIAYVAMRSTLPDAATALRAFCATNLAPYKVPARVIEVADLPKLEGSGKVDRSTLRSWAADVRFEVAR